MKSGWGEGEVGVMRGRYGEEGGRGGRGVRDKGGGQDEKWGDRVGKDDGWVWVGMGKDDGWVWVGMGKDERWVGLGVGKVRGGDERCTR